MGVVAREDRSREADGFLMFAPKTTSEVSYKQYVADLFYDGKNQETSARLTLRMPQFAESFVVKRTGTVDQVLGEIGGFEGLMIMLIGILSGLMHVLMRLRRQNMRLRCQYCARSDDGPEAVAAEAVKVQAEAV